MKKTEIEFWALSIIERVEKRQPVEDDRVELKSDWIDPVSAARRIAGHANAVGGEIILWLIGVDEKQGVQGVDYKDYAEWFSKVNSQFDQLFPDATCINIPYNGLTILAIAFETDRAPYVVKNPLGGSIQFEVPWRDNTSIKTANRSELLKILVPSQRIPIIHVLSGTLRARQLRDESKWSWYLELELYVGSNLSTPIILPFHQCSTTLDVAECLEDVPFKNLKLLPPSLSSGMGGYRISTSNSPPPQRPQYDSLTIDGTSTELIIQGPGKFRLRAESETEALEDSIVGISTIVKIILQPIDVDRSIHLEVTLQWVEKDSDDQSVRGNWHAVP